MKSIIFLVVLISLWTIEGISGEEEKSVIDKRDVSSDESSEANTIVAPQTGGNSISTDLDELEDRDADESHDDDDYDEDDEFDESGDDEISGDSGDLPEEEDSPIPEPEAEGAATSEVKEK